MKIMNWIIITASTIFGWTCSHPDILEPDQMKTEFRQNTAGQFNYLALGDSYTIGEDVEAPERFPVQLANWLNTENFSVGKPVIIARTGWTTDELAEGIKTANLSQNFNLVTLLIGVNNQYRGKDTAEYRIQFKELLQTAIDFTGSAKKVIVISIPDYGVTPFAAYRNPEKIGTEIDQFNAINREETLIAEAYYVDITGISREAKNDKALVASDGLHPSAEMYRLWVEQIFPKAKVILENQRNQ